MSDKVKWYAVKPYAIDDKLVIDTIYAVGETDKFLIIEKYSGVGTRREAKHSEWARWFKTPAEALDDAIAKERKDQETDRIRTQASQKAIDRFERIKATLEGQC